MFLPRAPVPFPHATQVFQTAENLGKFTAIRARYLCSVLQECFNNVPDFCVKDATPELQSLSESLSKFEYVADLHNDKQFGALATCDALLTAADWATTWNQLLKTSFSLEELVSNALKKFGIPTSMASPSTVPGLRLARSVKGAATATAIEKPEAEDVQEESGGEDGHDRPLKKQRLLKENGADAKASADQADKKKNALEEEDAEEEQEEEEEKQLQSLKCVNRFRLPELSILANSPEAEGLQLEFVSASFLRRFELELERVMWLVWTDFSVKEEQSVHIDLAKTNKVEAITVKYPTDLALRMPFRGKITCNPAGAKAPRLFATKAFGINFFVEPPSDNICVPAWGVKTTSRFDLAYFEQVVEKVRFALVRNKDVQWALEDPKENGGCGAVNPDLVDFHLVPLRPSDDDEKDKDHDRNLCKNSVWACESVPLLCLAWFLVLLLHCTFCHCFMILFK